MKSISVLIEVLPRPSNVASYYLCHEGSNAMKDSYLSNWTDFFMSMCGNTSSRTPEELRKSVCSESRSSMVNKMARACCPRRIAFTTYTMASQMDHSEDCLRPCVRLVQR